jgi:hypothetical protein
MNVSIKEEIPFEVVLIVNLLALPQGWHSAAIQVRVGDVSESTLFLPLSVNVASVKPCPQRVQLPVIWPHLTAHGQPVDTAGLPLWNVAPAPNRIMGVAVLPGGTQLNLPQAQACPGATRLNISNSLVDTFARLAAAAASTASAQWLQVQGSGFEMGPGGRFLLPAQVHLGEASTPTSGAYSATVVVLLENALSGANEVLSIEVSTVLAVGPVAWEQSNVTMQQVSVPAQDLPLPVGRMQGGILRLPGASGLLLSGRLLIATAVLRDVLGNEHGTGGNVISASVFVVSPGSRGVARSMQGAQPLHIDATVRLLSADETTAASALLPFAQQLALIGAKAPIGVMIDPAQLLMATHAPGASLQLSLTAHLLSTVGEALPEDLGSPVLLTAAGKTALVPAVCSSQQMPSGIGCACAAGYASTAASQSALVSSATLVCVPCPAGSFNNAGTVHSISAACKSCGIGMFSFEGSTVCQACPIGAICTGGYQFREATGLLAG